MSMSGDRDTAGRLRVGILGAGPVTQAIHLPTLARLSDDFEVRVVMDVHAATAETVARRAGAAHTTRAEDVFGDPSVDVIVICSPSQFHAEQVIAACRAGVKAILCEKPFAMTAEEANEIAAGLRGDGRADHRRGDAHVRSGLAGRGGRVGRADRNVAHHSFLGGHSAQCAV